MTQSRQSVPPGQGEEEQIERMLTRGGEMGELIHNKDWSTTPLGPIENWPQSLLTSLSICLYSRFPILIWWGPDFIKLYNDAYRPILGTTKHPQALGQRGEIIWTEIWDIIGPMLETVYQQGTATWSYDQQLLMDRHGFIEETYFTFSYSPIFEETGGIGGIFTAVTETTERVLGERRLKTLHDLGESTGEAKSAVEACRIMAAELEKNPADVPFALLYLLDEESQQAKLAASAGAGAYSDLCIPTVSLTDSEQINWPLKEVMETGQSVLVEGLSSRFPALGVDAPSQALILPIESTGHSKLAGFLVTGISARLMLTDDYRQFYKLVAGHIGTTIANAKAFEEERKHTEALAELDRAKTEFFSNVSHEFRTPLTLMVNPLEEILSDVQGLTDSQHKNLETAYRNSLRLQKLVNTLLDFSRIQSNRIHVFIQPMRLAEFTADLASTFRSVIEHAGLKLIVNCPPLPEPVFVDREMWEKIVLNLISNAFKFTFEGEIEVSVKSKGQMILLQVRDTGVGIAEQDIPHIFERFHRVQNSRSRTYEGSGIGLALVHELVGFLGGKIEVESTLDQGTTFTVSVPRGSSHVPEVHDTRLDPVPIPTNADSYTQEAWLWLGEQEKTDAPPAAVSYTMSELIASMPKEISGARLLIADDNADMRGYLTRLLEPYYQLEIATDGLSALEKIEKNPPDLVITDVMMPNLDGLGLLEHLRSNIQTRSLPVLLLSARAGEESRIEGLEAGASDYLIKPFSARELVARIEAQLRIAYLRKQAQTTIEDLIEVIADPFYALDENARFVYVNQHALQMWGKTREEIIGNNIWAVFPEGAASEASQHMRDAFRTQQPAQVEIFSEFLNKWVEVNYYPASTGLVVYFRDIDARKRREKMLTFLAEVQDLFSNFSAPDDIIQAVGERLRGFLDVSTSMILELENNGIDAQLYYISHDSDVPRFPDRIRLTDLVQGEPTSTARAGDAIVLNDIHDNPRLDLEAYKRLKIHSYITVPFQRNGEWKYLFAIMDDKPRQWREDEIALFHEIVHRLFPRLERARAEFALRESEKELRQTQARLMSALEAGLAGTFYWDIVHNHLITDENLRQYFSLSEKALTEGVPFDEFIPALHDDDRERVLEALNTAREQTGVYQTEYRVNHPDGAVRWLSSRGVIERDESGQAVNLAGFAVDITRMKKAEAVLRETEERLRLIIDSAKDYAIFSLDSEGRIMTWNRGAERMFGYNENEVIGLDSSVIYVPEDRDEGIPTREMSRALETGVAENERWHLRKDQSRFYASGLVQPIRDESGVLRGYTVIARDFTLRKQTETRSLILQQLTAELSSQLTLSEMAEVIVQKVQQTVGDSLISLFLLSDDGQWLERYFGDIVPQDLQKTYGRFPITAPVPVAESVRKCQIIQIDSQDDYERRYPETLAPILATNTHTILVLPLLLNEQSLGCIAISFYYPKRFSIQERELLIAISNLCAQSLQRAQLFEAEKTAKHKATLRADRLTRLQHLTAKLSEPLTFAQVAQLIVDELMLALGASSGVFNLLEDTNTFVVLYNKGSKLPKEEQEEWYRYSASPQLPVGDAALSRSPIWLESNDDMVKRYPTAARFAQVYTGAWIALPLSIEDRVIGVLGFSFEKPHYFDQEERDFMVAMSQQCTQALERARLYDAERDARTQAEETANRITRLQALTAALSEAPTISQVINVCINQSLPVIGAQMGNIVLLGEDGTTFEVLNSPSTSKDAKAYFENFPFDKPSPLTDAVKSGKPVWLPSMEEFKRLYPALAANTNDLLTSQAFANVPLIVDKRVIGGIGFAFSTAQAFHEADQGLMIAVAQQCAQAIERARLYEEEAKARQAAEEANEIKLKFLGMISHELRTPLASIKGFSSTLLAQDVRFSAEKQERFLRIIDEEADKLTGLVEQLLDLSRLQSGTLAIEPKLQTIDDVINIARTQLHTLTSKHKLVLEIPKRLPQVLVDSQRIAQVLVNLVGNSAKFSMPDTPIRIKGIQVNQHIQIEVSDEGIGIPLESRDKVFEAFEQISREASRQHMGAGLGLAICKSIIEAHEGRIWIEDQDAGTTIVFTLPVADIKPS